jgi:hypothetical protein
MQRTKTDSMDLDGIGYLNGPCEGTLSEEGR